MKNRRCLNLACPLRGKVSSGNIVRHGFYRTRSGKRRRYRCGECGKTFSSTKGTPYYRLRHRRATFDGVIALRVEGVSISSISRIKGIAWNTVARWLRCRRASSRRDSHVRGQQEDTELGLRYDRSLVSALAIDGDGKAKLPEHSRSVSRPFETDEFRASSLDRHGWIRILPEGHPSLLRSSVSLRPGPKNAQETIVSSRSNAERCTEPRGDSKTRSITPRTPRH